MKICEILVPPDRAGFILYDEKGCQAVPTPGYERTMTGVMDTPVVVNDTLIDPKLQPQAWFDGLPVMYHGSRFRAVIHNTESVDIYKDGKQVGKITLDPLDIETDDTAFEDFFHEAIDEGIEGEPFEVGLFMKLAEEYGYEVKA